MMSAIWGCVDLLGDRLAQGICDEMEGPLNRYQIDRFDSCLFENALMGCGHQYILPGARREALPVLDRERNLMFTADAMLDNRRELARALAPEQEMPPDGALLFLAYLKWGRELNAHVRGAYAFAAYDHREGTLILSADHAYSRSVYYCRQGGRVFFGTSLDSVVGALPTPPPLNRRWISDCLSMTGIRTVTEPFETPYQGILRVGPRRYLLFTPQQTQSVVHWDPLSLPPLVLENDTAYREQFLALMRSAAREIAETGAEAGIYLSSGMDSAAVGAVTAECLAGENRILRSYTSVPSSGYQFRNTRYETQNEAEGVKALCQRHPNISPSFFPLDGMDALSCLPEILRFHELPFKTAPNMMWLYALAGEAQKDGCRIMLNGQMGNSTISWGSVFDLASTLWGEGHPLGALDALNHYGRYVGISRKRLLRIWVQGSLPRFFGKGRPTDTELLEGSLVNRGMAIEHGSPRRILEQGFHGGGRQFYPRNQILPKLLGQDAVTVLGEAETKLGLARGVFVRDITRDKRIWEFCLRAPMSCFVDGVRDRRLVRDYLGALLPDEISENHLRYGLQSADWVYRLHLRWPEVEKALSSSLLSPDVSCYFESGLVQAFLRQSGEGPPRQAGPLMELLCDYPAALFLQGHSNR